MCELLIMAFDKTHPDPIKDRRGCYKRGDVVVVMPDGHVWGKEETLPKFFVVKIPGLAVDTAKQFLAPEMDFLDPKQQTILTRRKWRVLVDSVPLAVKNTLLSTGSVSVSLAQVRNYIQDRTTGLTY